MTSPVLVAPQNQRRVPRRARFSVGPMGDRLRSDVAERGHSRLLPIVIAAGSEAQFAVRHLVDQAVFVRDASGPVEAGASSIVCTTTNDNVSALAFWQRMGLRIVTVRPGAVDEARRIKPTIPWLGERGIEIHDELDLRGPVRS